jgi:hypothetical protein
MIIASFLVKTCISTGHQGIPVLVASARRRLGVEQSCRWQWVAGNRHGRFAPISRVFNPVTQGKTFDLMGTRSPGSQS